MSTEGLPDAFPRLSYAEGVTGATVRGGHTITRAVAANIVALARPAKRVGPTSAMAASNSFRVNYVRSHASIKQLWLAWYYRPDPDPAVVPALISVTTTIRDAAGNSITSASAIIPTGFDGTSYYADAASVTRADEPVLGGTGYIDLDAAAVVLVDGTWEFEFAWSRASTDVTLDRVEGWECPRTQVSDADLYGALTGPLNPGSPIIAGSVTTAGYERIAKTVEGAIACNRALLSVAWPLDVAIAPGTTSASYTAFTRMLEGGTTPWPWRVRTRVVYAPNSAAGEPARVRYLYQVTGGGTASIRCNTGATGSPYDVTGLTSATWAWSAWTTVAVPTDGAGRVATITFEGKTTAGTLSVAGIALEEFQP